MKNFIKVSSKVESTPSEQEIRTSLADAYPGYELESYSVENGVLTATLIKAKVSRSVRSLDDSDFGGPPPSKGKKPKGLDDAEDDSDEGDSADDAEKDDSETDTEDGDKKDKDPVVQLHKIKDEITSLLDQLGDKADEVSDKADKVDQIHELTHPEEGGILPEDVGPTPGKPAGPPRPPAPTQGLDKRKRPLPGAGVPTFTKKRTAFRPNDIPLAQAIQEIESDEHFGEYRLVEVKEQPEHNRFVAKLERREE